MIFKKLSPKDAVGTILAHSQLLGGRRLRKGTRLTQTDIEEMDAYGKQSVTVAIPESDDVLEDAAAFALASAISGTSIKVEKPLMGRCNLRAYDRGLLKLDGAVLDDINLVHESMTIATLKSYTVVSAGQLVATIKSIPYAVSGEHLRACLDIASKTNEIICVKPFQSHSIGLIQTSIDVRKDSLLDKTRRVLSRRLENLNSHISHEIRCAHSETEVMQALARAQALGVDMIILSGASAVVDRHDVIPAAINQAGGRVLHYGMPVDPGNLLLLAYLDRRPVLGMPGCARSPRFNGFDMVLERLLARIPVLPADIMRMGVGGLLSEIHGRPQPRAGLLEVATAVKARRVTAVVLAAGQSIRMGHTNKLLMEFNGCSMIEQVVKTLTGSTIDQILVITGRNGIRLKTALKEYDLEFVDNPVYAEGLSTSIVCGLNHIDDSTEAALIVLADMPMITHQSIERLVSAFDPDNGCEICVPVYQGKRGNPVLWSRRFFDEMMHLEGDTGAKHLLYKHDDLVKEVPMQDAGILIDFDTRQSLSDFNM